MATDDDRLIAQLLASGVDAQALDACRAQQQAALDESGAAPPLAQLLVRGGAITPERLAECLRALSADPLDATRVAGEPRQIGRYLLGRELGRGAAAVVHAARDTQLERDVAIKVIGEDASVGLLERLRREAAVLGRLRHPHVIAVHDVGHVAGFGHYIVMSRAEGSLEDALPALDIDAGVRLLAEAAAGLGAAHQAGVVHRDVKPSNLLLEGDRLRVSDFGLARDLTAQTQLTRTGAVLGTVCYMAPEQVAGRKAGPPADVWALGVILYQLLAGQLPFGCDTQAAVFDRIRAADPPPPRRLRRGVPRALEAVCRKALSRRPRDRYPTAAHLGEALERWQRGESVDAGRGWGTVAPWLRRNPWRAAVLVGLAAVAALVIGRGLWLRQSLRQARASAAQAHAAGDWRRALAAAERGLSAAPGDAELTRLAAACQRELDRAETARQAALRRVDGARALDRRLAPLAAVIEGAPQMLYIAGVDIRARMAAVEAAVEQLAALTREATGAEHARLWRLLGTGCALVGWRGRAVVAFERALALQLDDGRARYELGRLHVERAMAQVLTRGGAASHELSRHWAERASACLAGVGDGWAGATPLELHVARTLVALARRDIGQARTLAREGLQEFGDVPGSESLWIVIAGTRTGAARIRALDKALVRCPHHAWALFMRGAAHGAAGDVARALADYDRALNIHPRLTQALNNRGLLRDVGGQADAARADYDRAIALDPTFAEAYLNRGCQRMQSGDAAGAAADLARAIELGPDAVAAQAHHNRVTLRFSAGDAQGALADAERTVALDPTLGHGYLARGFVRSRLGQHAAAREDFDRAAEMMPDEPRVYVGRAGLRLQTGDRAGALADFDRAVKLDGRLYGAVMNRGRLYLESGRLALADADLERAIALNRRRPEGWLYRGVLRSQQRRHREALADLDRARALGSRGATVHYNRAAVLQQLGRHHEALDAASEAIRRAPKHAPSRALRGRLLVKLERAAEAAIDFEVWTRLEPRAWRAWVHLALAIAPQDPAKALSALRTARPLAPASQLPVIDTAIKQLKGKR